MLVCGQATTPATEPGFVGTVAFFVPAEHSDSSHRLPVRFRIPATEAIRRSSPPGAITSTLVPIAYPDRAMGTQGIEIVASLDLVRT
jgi:hypothetical protein